MKIISKFKDYYDGLASHDASTGVYERTQSKIPVDWIGYASSTIGQKRSYELSTGLVGFCGKLYPFIRYENEVENPKYHCLGNPMVSSTIKTVEYLYSFEEFEVVREDVKDVKSKRWRWNGMNDLMRGWDKNEDNAKLWFEQDWATLLAKRENRWGGNGKTPVYAKPRELFVEHKVPYFFLGHLGIKGASGQGYGVILNPCLTDYQFYRMFDAYTAYQEIEMFMNNEIVRPDDPFIEPISDEAKAQAHGFDKFSFRKDKCKPKRRKK
jgi:hypothetical protein